MAFITINDIFEELIDENTKLNECLNVLIRFKVFIDFISDDFKTNLNPKFNQMFNGFNEELEEVFKRNQMTLITKEVLNLSTDKLIEFCETKPQLNGESLMSSKFSLKPFIDKKCLTQNTKKTTKKRLNSDNSEDIYHNFEYKSNEYKSKKLLKQNNYNKCVKPLKRGDNLNEENPNLDEMQGFCCTFIGCHKILKTKRILRIHMKRHTFELQFKCNFNGKGCGYNTNKKREFVNHMNTHNGVKAYSCEYCSKSLYSKDSLKNHIEIIHKLSDQILICDLDNCNKQFKTELSFKNHQKFQHLIEKKFVCKEANCGMKFISASLLNNHKYVHSGERPLKCQVEGCPKAFITNYDLSLHLKTHSSERNYKCEINGCNKLFKTAQNLKRHIVLHSDIEFKCEWPGCDYTAKTEKRVRSHKIVHSSERRFACEWPQCGKRFKTNQILKSHLRIHNNDKKYSCSWPGCQYRCTDLGNIYKHKRVHIKN